MSRATVSDVFNGRNTVEPASIFIRVAGMGTSAGYRGRCRAAGPCRTSRLIASSRNISECHVFVDSRFGRKAENTVADDVVLDLIATAGDPVARGTEHLARPCVRSPLAGVGGQSWSEQFGGDV